MSQRNLAKINFGRQVPAVSEPMVSFTVKLGPELAAALDDAQKRGGEGRAQFTRNAIAEKIRRAGLPLGAGAHLAPERKGVGGSPTHKPKTAYSDLKKKRPGRRAKAGKDVIITTEPPDLSGSFNEGPPTDPEMQPRPYTTPPEVRKLISDEMDKLKGTSGSGGTRHGKPRGASK